MEHSNIQFIDADASKPNMVAVKVDGLYRYRDMLIAAIWLKKVMCLKENEQLTFDAIKSEYSDFSLGSDYLAEKKLIINLHAKVSDTNFRTFIYGKSIDTASECQIDIIDRFGDEKGYFLLLNKSELEF